MLEGAGISALDILREDSSVSMVLALESGTLWVVSLASMLSGLLTICR